MAQLEPVIIQDIYSPLGDDYAGSMLTARFTPEGGWQMVELGPRRPLTLDPATAALHYGQSAFEGIRAYRQPDGGLALFRPHDYAWRLSASCRRMAIPAPTTGMLIDWWSQFCVVEEDYLGDDPEAALYLRPLILATDRVLGARPSHEYLFLLLAVKATPFRQSGQHALDVLVATDYERPTPAGLGRAKSPGNYGGGMLALHAAREQGCDQVLWLDADRHMWVEEMGTMNVFFDFDGILVSPAPSETIIDGVTRATVLQLCADHGIAVEERPIHLDEMIAALGRGGLNEAFGCSTGAGLTPIGSLLLEGERLALPPTHPRADRLRNLFADLAHGRAPDPFGWRLPVRK